MVSIRCKMAVKAVLDDLGLHYRSLELGEIDIKEDLTDHQMDILRKRLLDFSLEMIDDKKAIIIEKIKNVVTTYLPQFFLSYYIAL